MYDIIIHVPTNHFCNINEKHLNIRHTYSSHTALVARDSLEGKYNIYQYSSNY